ncbi:MAG: GNAT family N-acetyltransferase, partial [Candidatus Eremiobacteraeota bacterium]|nr:GNAT family N-acetyltransferase [Candidatus Eremiobacteraeota bacterium]
MGRTAQGGGTRRGRASRAHVALRSNIRRANLLADLDDERFGARAVHHELEALGARGLVPLREHRTPERILGWIDAEFGGTWSSEAAAGGIWIAEDERGPLAFAAYDARGLRFHWLRAWAQRDAVGFFGPLGVSARARRLGIGTTLARAALYSLRERGYRQALIPAVEPNLVPFFERIADARTVEGVHVVPRGVRARAVVLASGNGSNFQAVAEGAAAGDLPLEIVGLVADRPRAFVLERARSLGVPAVLTAWDRGNESREAFDARVLASVAAFQPELVLLLGWMHVLPATFVARFPEMLNVHPAFLPLDPQADVVTLPDFTSLPAFRGARALDDALAAGAKWAGASVHRVGVAV